MALPEITASPAVTFTAVPYVVKKPFEIGEIKGVVPIDGTPTRRGGGLVINGTLPLFDITQWLAVTAGLNAGGDIGGDHKSGTASLAAGLRWKSVSQAHTDLQAGLGYLLVKTPTAGDFSQLGAFVALGLTVRPSGPWLVGMRTEAFLPVTQLGTETDFAAPQVRLMASIGYNLDGEDQAKNGLKTLKAIQTDLSVANTYYDGITTLYGHTLPNCIPLMKDDELDNIYDVAGFVNWIGGVAATGMVGMCVVPNIDDQIAHAKDALNHAKQHSDNGKFQTHIEATETRIDNIKNTMAKKALDLLIAPKNSSLSRLSALGKVIQTGATPLKDAGHDDKLKTYEGSLLSLSQAFDKAIVFIPESERGDYLRPKAIVNCLMTGNNCPKDIDASLSVPKLKEKVGIK